MSFEDLGLSTEILRAVQEQNYTTPTPIQASAIPAVLEGRDLLAGSQTGTGKTASFTLPLLQQLLKTPPRDAKKFRPIRALIVTPTRELASQVSESVQTYGKHLPLRSNVVFGGVKIGSQIHKLRRGTDVLVATPGRLLDLVNQKYVDLSCVEILVLDEADRMLDMGFMPDIRRIISLIPAKTQNLLFSATYSNHIKKLASDLLDNPKIIDIGSGNTVSAQIKHVIHPINPEQKRQALAYLIGSNDWKQVLVFTKTKRGAERLSKQLDKDGLRSTAIHGDKTQAARGQALAKFKQGRVRVLVATDVAARGLDINDLSHVVNYDLPMVAEDYIHRIGRTGRAGNTGEAISLVSPEEKFLLLDIEQLLKKSLPKVVIEDYEPDYDLAVFNKPRGSRPGNSSRRKRPSSGNANRNSNGRSKSYTDSNSSSRQDSNKRTSDKRSQPSRDVNGNTWAENKPRRNGSSSGQQRNASGSSNSSSSRSTRSENENPWTTNKPRRDTSHRPSGSRGGNSDGKPSPRPNKKRHYAA